MTLEENIDKYESAVRNWDVKHLKNDPDFMKICREDVEFREYVLSVRPDMANEKQPKIKFLGLAGNKVPSDVKTAQIEPEPVEEIPKAVQYYRDVVKLRDGLL